MATQPHHLPSEILLVIGKYLTWEEKVPFARVNKVWYKTMITTLQNS